ncbi:MAG: large-conductance mechanosensitive channel protein MscL [Bacteroidia bacterium]
MSMIQEFKDFAMKGNVIDLAIATVLGGAFNAIVGSVVDNVLMPIIGIVTGGVNFDAIALKVGDAQLFYGKAIGASIKFIIIAMFLFMIVKAMNAAKKKEVAAPVAPPAPSKEEVLLGEIRDLLKK